MIFPESIRINAQFPFPALVTASGPVTITKQNGIWSVGLNYTNVAGMPDGTDLNTVLLLLYNTALQTYQTISAASLVGASASISPTNIGFANSPYVPLVTDSVLYVDTSGGAVVINLTAAGARESRPLSIKDITGNAAANNITINRNGAETIEGLTNIKVSANYGGYRLYPATGKYVIAP